MLLLCLLLLIIIIIIASPGILLSSDQTDNEGRFFVTCGDNSVFLTDTQRSTPAASPTQYYLTHTIFASCKSHPLLHPVLRWYLIKHDVMQLLFHRSVHYVSCASLSGKWILHFLSLAQHTHFFFFYSSLQLRSGQLSVLDWQGC